MTPTPWTMRCTYCRRPIRWVAVDGERHAVDPDGTPHHHTCEQVYQARWGRAA